MFTYNKKVAQLTDQYDAGVEEASTRRPGHINRSVKNGATVGAKIIVLGQKYKKYYDRFVDEKEGQRRFNRKMSLITENARHDPMLAQ